MILVTLPIVTFVFLNEAQGVSCVDPLAIDSRLETDCSIPPAENTVVVIPDVSYPFRADYLTLHECMSYQRIPCSATKITSCDVHEHGKTTYPEFNPFNKTYFELDCGQDGWRSISRDYTKKFSLVSSKRALTVIIKERSDSRDPVHSDVFEPVRDQVIDITIQAGATTVVTSKIYDLGILPSLVALRIVHAKNLSIKRRDFNLIPNVRLIVFRQSTISEMEPHTFTDLPNLSGLSVDKGLWDAFYAIKMAKEYTWEPRPAGLWTAADFDKIHRIHCDCSFAWYRNFLRSKPELTEFKQSGEMAVIGNYMSQFFFTFSLNSDVISVDCAMNLTKDNYNWKNLFSYNSTCFGPC